MALTVTTDHGEITAQIDQLLAADPVRGTILGSIRGTLDDNAWSAVDGDRLAVRSGKSFPVVITGDWIGLTPELASLLRELPGLHGLSGTPGAVRALVDELGRDTPRSLNQRLFRCDALAPPAGVIGAALTAGDAHRALVRDWYAAFVAEAQGLFGDPRAAADQAVDSGTCLLWRAGSGEPVALAVARPAVAGSGRVGPVYTPPAHRGRGYGSAVTAAATHAILDAGAIPVLFTDLANPTSNKIYQALGYRPVEDRLVVSFG
ncbi:GNAT family N-acetyltransferase [uncultured Jatrophihabitans sp.]|uniref:GNAT family N-acetyltransferase n=1 Tax=uncultured Jatrophihabitans sp. TaxID=1610747 RepID=UPI0035CB3AB7